LTFLIARDVKEDDFDEEEDEMEVEVEEETQKEDEMDIEPEIVEGAEEMVEEDVPQKKKLSGKQKKAKNMLHQDVKRRAITLLNLFMQRHESYQIESEPLDVLHKAFRDGFEKLTSNVTVLPNVFQVMFAWDTLGTVVYWTQYPDLLSSMISLIKSEKISSKAMNPILDFLSRLIHGGDLIIPNTEFTVNQALLAPNTNLIVECVHEAIQKEELKEYRSRMLFIVHNLKQFYNKETNPDTIVALYAQGLHSKETLENSLQVLKEWIPKCSNETKAKYIKQFSISFVTQKDLSIRMTICEIFAGIGGKGSEIYRLLTALNSYSSSALDTVDLESRFDAFRSIIKLDDSIKSLSEDMLLPIVANLCFFSVDLQWVIRENSAKALTSIIRMIYAGTNHLEAKKMICHHLQKLVKTDQVLKANVITPIIAELFKWDPALKEYKLLDSFLGGLTEDDHTKRIRVITDLTAKFKVFTDMTPFFDYIMPLLVAYMTDASEQLRDATSKLIHHISKLVPWPSLEKIMTDMFYILSHHKIGSDKKTESIVLKLVCTMIQEWSDRDATRIAKSYFRKTIPQLYSYMWSKENLVRMEIAVLIIKILKSYDRDELQRQLSRIVLEIIGKLADKKNDRQRELSRATLIAILKELGSHYFFLVLSQLSKMLNEGYKISVLHYTLIGLLKALKTDIKGNIDDTEKTLPILLDILLCGISKPVPLVAIVQIKRTLQSLMNHLKFWQVWSMKIV
jgi:hypothetical protein